MCFGNSDSFDYAFPFSLAVGKKLTVSLGKGKDFLPLFLIVFFPGDFHISSLFGQFLVVNLGLYQGDEFIQRIGLGFLMVISSHGDGSVFDFLVTDYQLY